MSHQGPTPKCDFCQRELRFGSTWDFPCRDHQSAPGVISEGVWSACRKCTELIAAGHRDKLAKRGSKATLRLAPPGTTPEQALAATRKVQDTFWANRTGPPRQETREEWDKGVRPIRRVPREPEE